VVLSRAWSGPTETDKDHRDVGGVTSRFVSNPVAPCSLIQGEQGSLAFTEDVCGVNVAAAKIPAVSMEQTWAIYMWYPQL